MQTKLPGAGGRYIRDPETGEIKPESAADQIDAEQWETPTPEPAETEENGEETNEV